MKYYESEERELHCLSCSADVDAGGDNSDQVSAVYMVGVCGSQVERRNISALAPLFIIALAICMFYVVFFFVYVGMAVFGSGWVGLILLALIVGYPIYKVLREREKKSPYHTQ